MDISDCLREALMGELSPRTLLAFQEWVGEIVRDAVRQVLREQRGDALVDKPAPGEMPDAAFVRIKQAAKLVDAHPKTIHKLIRDGVLNTYGLGREKRVNVRELLAYLARSKPAGLAAIDIDQKARELAFSTGARPNGEKGRR